MTTRDLSLTTATPNACGARGLATTMLRATSRALDALAARLALSRAESDAAPVLEFYADAGAPEGALYVNGQLIGHVIGVTRL